MESFSKGASFLRPAPGVAASTTRALSPSSRPRLGTTQRDFNLERATIDRTRIDANHAETGGGIDNPGQLAILQSGVENNVARGVGARDGNAGRVQRAANRRALGAGIYNGHSLNIVHSTLARNLAEAANGEAAGGGLYVAEGSTGTALQDTPVNNNRVTGEHPHGGGIFVAGGNPVTLAPSFVRANQPENCYPAGQVTGCSN